MARIDYEGAWNELAELIASREGQGWGTDTLLAEMQKIAVRHHVSEDFIQKARRILNGDELTTQTHVSEETAAASDGAEPPASKPDPEPSKDKEIRDERAADTPEVPAAV